MHRLTCPHTHEQNGTAECKIRHIVDIGITLLGHSNVPFKYWNFTFETSVFLINRMPTQSLSNKIPFQILVIDPKCVYLRWDWMRAGKVYARSSGFNSYHSNDYG